MIFLAKNYGKKEIYSLKNISKNESISFDYLEKIFFSLEKANLVKGKRGRLGGYALSRPPSKITADEIIKAIEGKLSLVECKGCLKEKKCPAKGLWDELQLSFSSTLSSITLLKLANKK